MSLQISEFAKALKHSGARASLFEVTMSGQKPLEAAGKAAAGVESATSDMKFMCRATTIPGLTITPITTQYFGREIKTPGEMEFADWSITILNDNNMRVRRFLEAWQNIINSHADNVFNAKDSYTADTKGAWPWTGSAIITQFNKTGGTTQKYTMKECWPTSIDPIEMSYDNTGTLQEYGCTFALNYWEHSTPSGAGEDRK